MDRNQIAICIIVENLPVPLDRRVWQEARTLTEEGYRVSVICPTGSGFDARYETLEGIEIYRYPVWEASGPLGYLLEYGLAFLWQFRLALKVYRRSRFRVLQACNPPDTIFLIGAFFKLLGVRFIFDHHDLNPELFEVKFGRRGFFYRLVCLAERLTFRTADVSIATNESYREVAIGRGGMSPERVFIVRSCPDLKKVRSGTARPELKEGKKFLVVYVGVMGPQDGLDLLLESIHYTLPRPLKSEISNFKLTAQDVLFVLIGAGTELPRLKALASAMGLDAVVKFTGRLPDAELAAYLSSADLSVAPDPLNPMNDKSTMNKILESMAYGLPVVLYDLTEGRRSAGDAALYARPNDPADFAEKILQLLASESLRHELGARGRRRIEAGLNWEKEKGALLAAYKTALR